MRTQVVFFFFNQTTCWYPDIKIRSIQLQNSERSKYTVILVCYASYRERKYNSNWLQQQRGRVRLDNRGLQSKMDFVVSLCRRDPVTRWVFHFIPQCQFHLKNPVALKGQCGCTCSWAVGLFVGLFVSQNVIIIHTYPTLRNRTWKL